MVIKMKKSNLLIILGLVSLFHNCIERKSALDIPFEGNKIVAYSFLCPSKPISVQVTQLEMIKGRPDTSVWLKTAIVKVFENKVFLQKLEYGSAGFYTSTNQYRPKKGNWYHFEITAPDFPSVVSEADSIPSYPVKFKKIAVTDSISIYYGSVAGNLAITFDASKVQASFYGCSFKSFNMLRSITERPILERAYNGFGGLPCEFADMPYSLDLGIVFSNKCFQGDNQKVNFGYSSVFNDNGISVKTDSLHVLFHTLTPNTFKFAQSLYLHYASRDLQSVPSTVFSNVKGGYGFIGCYNTDTIVVRLK
jgi:hypothetical protein